VIGLFKQKTPANILFVFILGILLKLPGFKTTVLPATDTHSTVLYNFLVKALSSLGNNNSILFAIITYLLLFTQAMQINKIMNDQRMLQKVTYLPAVSYLMITSLIPAWNFFSAPLLLNSIVLITLNFLFKLYNQTVVKGRIYNIGLLIGIGSFIYFPALLMFVWVMLVLLIMRTFRITEWLICILGVLTPFYFYAFWLFFTDFDKWGQLINLYRFYLPSYHFSTWLFFGVSLIAIPFLSGALLIQSNLRKMLIQARKNWSVILLYFMFASGLAFLFNQNSAFEPWILITIPLSVFHSGFYIYSTKRWLPAFFFWVIIAFVLLFQYVGPGW
jgi:hypothetical protein